MNEEILNKYNKIVIVGNPMSGKTTLSNQIIDREVIHTDDFINQVSWKAAPDFIINKLKDKSKYIVEGVQGFRLIRTGLRENSFKPDCIIYINSIHPPLPKHFTMIKAQATIWNDIIMLNKDIPVIKTNGI